LLRTIHDRLRRRILADGYVQVDETPVKVLDPDRGGHAALAYLWTYLSPLSQAIVFDFDLSRGRGNLREFFPTEWEGVLQSDGYDAYDRFLGERPSIIHAGCMAHYHDEFFIRRRTRYSQESKRAEGRWTLDKIHD